MIFWLVVLGGVVRGQRTAVVQGAPVPGEVSRWCRVTYTDAQSEKDMKRGVERARAARETREAASA